MAEGDLDFVSDEEIMGELRKRFEACHFIGIKSRTVGEGRLHMNVVGDLFMVQGMLTHSCKMISRAIDMRLGAGTDGEEGEEWKGD